MRFSTVALSAAAMAAAGVQAQNASVVTEVVTAYTTYCPYATEITHGASTYTVTEPTTLTISNCPCTITKPVMTATVSSCNTCNSTPMATPPAMTPLGTPYAKYNMSTPLTPLGSTPMAASSMPPASSVVAESSAASSGAATTTPASAEFTGAAGKYSASGLLAIAGFAAYFL